MNSSNRVWYNKDMIPVDESKIRYKQGKYV